MGSGLVEQVMSEVPGAFLPFHSTTIVCWLLMFRLVARRQILTSCTLKGRKQGVHLGRPPTSPPLSVSYKQEKIFSRSFPADFSLNLIGSDE